MMWRRLVKPWHAPRPKNGTPRECRPAAMKQKVPKHRCDGTCGNSFRGLLCFRCSFGFPIAGLSFTVAFKFGFPFDGISGDFPVVFHRPLVSVELTRHAERDFIAFYFSVLDFAFNDFAILPGRAEGAGDFLTFDFQLQ